MSAFRWLGALIAAFLLAIIQPVRGAGVTVITHGFNGNVTDWIIPMAEAIPGYGSFPGTAFSCYEISVTENGSGQTVATAAFLGGVAPTDSDSGEILVKLDWSALAGIGGASTTTVANAAVGALLSTTLIPALGGSRLAELPLHLIGHSRGGSVVSEMARLLGAQGVWVDQVTTLDPRPVPEFGDADVMTYTNVLFADNYWQTIGGFLVPVGHSVVGAYNRKLTTLSGGYSSPHSDVHLWYHGTIDLATPITVDGATIGSTQRSAWWTSTEMAGAANGYYYSATGGGDRLSTAEPAGVGNGRVSDGFNKRWDFGGGVASNRTALPANNGLWPNVIRAVRANALPVPSGETFPLTLYHQAGADVLSNVTVHISLDADFNPHNGAGIEIDTRTFATTGTNVVTMSALTVTADIVPGSYALCVRIDLGARIRYLYLRDPLLVTPSLDPPAVDVRTLTRLSGGQVRFTVMGLPGQTVQVTASSELSAWTPIGTQTFAGTTWVFTDTGAGTYSRRFYKAELVP